MNTSHQVTFDFCSYKRAQSGYHQRLDTSDYGELLLEQR